MQPDHEAESVGEDKDEALARKRAELEAKLLAERPALGIDGWRREAREQLLHYAATNGFLAHVQPLFPNVKPVDHAFGALKTQQILAAFEDVNGMYEVAFLLAVLTGEKVAIDAGKEALKLGALPTKLYEGPFPPFA